MGDVLINIQERLSDFSWIQGVDTAALSREIDEVRGCLNGLNGSSYRPRVLVAEKDPLRFLSVLFAALTEEIDLFLGNPEWGLSEQRETLQMVSPDLFMASEWNEGIFPVERRNEESPDVSGLLLMISTGGSSGKIKFAMHSMDNLRVAVEGLCQHFSMHKINSYCVLPLYHVSGLMQVMRALLTNGTITLEPFEKLEKGRFPETKKSIDFISLVPTQLNRLLAVEGASDWLRSFRAIFLGGGPAWPDLLEQGRKVKLPLSLTYGMTESAAQVATLKPEAFLSGEENVGKALPHVEVFIEEEDPTEDVGSIWLKTDALFLGYYPELRKGRELWKTDDLGSLDKEGFLTIFGRTDEVINTGGEKVYPREVEAVIRKVLPVFSVIVFGIPDKEWGELVCAVYQTDSNKGIVESEMRKRLKRELSSYKIPKKWILYPGMLENAQGKINREAIRSWVLDT